MNGIDNSSNSDSSTAYYAIRPTPGSILKDPVLFFGFQDLSLFLNYAIHQQVKKRRQNLNKKKKRKSNNDDDFKTKNDGDDDNDTVVDEITSLDFQMFENFDDAMEYLGIKGHAKNEKQDNNDIHTRKRQRISTDIKHGEEENGTILATINLQQLQQAQLQIQQQQQQQQLQNIQQRKLQLQQQQSLLQIQQRKLQLQQQTQQQTNPINKTSAARNSMTGFASNRQCVPPFMNAPANAPAHGHAIYENDYTKRHRVRNRIMSRLRQGPGYYCFQVNYSDVVFGLDDMLDSRNSHQFGNIVFRNLISSVIDKYTKISSTTSSNGKYLIAKCIVNDITNQNNNNGRFLQKLTKKELLLTHDDAQIIGDVDEALEVFAILEEEAAINKVLQFMNLYVYKNQQQQQQQGGVCNDNKSGNNAHNCKINDSISNNNDKNESKIHDSSFPTEQPTDTRSRPFEAPLSLLDARPIAATTTTTTTTTKYAIPSAAAINNNATDHTRESDPNENRNNDSKSGAENGRSCPIEQASRTSSNAFEAYLPLLDAPSAVASVAVVGEASENCQKEDRNTTTKANIRQRLAFGYCFHVNPGDIVLDQHGILMDPRKNTSTHHYEGNTVCRNLIVSASNEFAKVSATCVDKDVSSAEQNRIAKSIFENITSNGRRFLQRLSKDELEDIKKLNVDVLGIADDNDDKLEVFVVVDEKIAVEKIKQSLNAYLSPSQNVAATGSGFDFKKQQSRTVAKEPEGEEKMKVLSDGNSNSLYVPTVRSDARNNRRTESANISENFLVDERMLREEEKEEHPMIKNGVLTI